MMTKFVLCIIVHSINDVISSIVRVTSAVWNSVFLPFIQTTTNSQDMVLLFEHFITKLKSCAQDRKIHLNNDLVEITRYINKLINFLEYEWSFTMDHHKAYKKMLPVLFAIKKTKLFHEPIKISINDLLLFLEYYGDRDLKEWIWTNHQIRFVSITLINAFEDLCF